jgi:DNA-binding XRE family transcriptional regulator
MAAADGGETMSDFDQLIQDIEDEARAEGPEAVAELAAFDTRFALASALIGLRKAMHLTQAQLAGVTGIPQSEISRIERGQTNPTVQTVDRLLAPLGARLEIVPVKQAA